MDIFKSLAFLAMIICVIDCRDPRSVVELTRCVRIAEPLIHDPDYIFPLTASEIKNVCEMWDGFVDCVRKYTDAFLTESQQKEFEKAIKPSMESIHQLCIQDVKYQQAYLNYAPCMKKVSTELKYCGGHYNFLARIAESSSERGPAICCGYHKFRSCALQEAAKECEQGLEPTPVEGETSSHFVSSMLNRALGFLLQKCSHFEPSSQDCSLFLNDEDNKDLHSYSGVSQDSNKESPFNVADLLQPSSDRRNPSSSDRGSPSPSDRKSPSESPLVTIKPRPYDNSFTWDPNAAGSFFPTDVDNSISGPKSQEFRGQEGDNAAMPLSSSFFTFTMTIALSIRFRHSF